MQLNIKLPLKQKLDWCAYEKGIASQALFIINSTSPISLNFTLHKTVQ